MLFVSLRFRMRRGRRQFLNALDIALNESRCLLVNVQRETVVRPLARVAVHSRGNAVCHDVLANPLQLILGAVLQVKESFETNFLALPPIIQKIYIILPFAYRKFSNIVQF